MRTKTRTSKPRRRSGPPGTISDPRTLRNPYARPSRGSRRPLVETALCAVVDRTAERIEARMIVLGHTPLSWDNMARWSIIYACRYRSGRRDVELHEVDLIAVSRADALTRLPQCVVGFDVERVEVFGCRGPLTRVEVAEIRAANEALDAERRQLGIYGPCEMGGPRDRAVQEWLQEP